MKNNLTRFLFNKKFVNVHDSAMAYFYDPSEEWNNPTDCTALTTDCECLTPQVQGLIAVLAKQVHIHVIINTIPVDVHQILA